MCPLAVVHQQLVHNQISPHNAAFYKLLDELWGEAEDLMDRGITGSGQGFDAPSAGRLGSHAFIPLHNPPEHKMGDVMRKVCCAAVCLWCTGRGVDVLGVDVLGSVTKLGVTPIMPCLRSVRLLVCLPLLCLVVCRLMCMYTHTAGC